MVDNKSADDVLSEVEGAEEVKTSEVAEGAEQAAEALAEEVEQAAESLVEEAEPVVEALTEDAESAVELPVEDIELPVDLSTDVDLPVDLPVEGIEPPVDLPVDLSDGSVTPSVGDAAKAIPGVAGAKNKLVAKFGKKKLAIIGGILAAIVAVGIGFYQWHETPEFCVTICHTPMDKAYLQTLYANPYESATDKWGNEVPKAKAMLASVHGNMGKRCMACHVPAIEEQVTEGIEWIQGNYYNPLSERDLSRLVFYRKAGETEFCLNTACHNITKSGLTDETADMARNPHSWHHTEYTCSDCHKAHRASIMICSQCHEDAEIPAGWLTWEESQNLEHQYMSWNEEQFLKS